MKVLLVPAPDLSASTMSGVGKYLATLVRGAYPVVTYEYFNDTVSVGADAKTVQAGSNAGDQRLSQGLLKRTVPAWLRLAMGYAADTLRLARALRPYRHRIDVVHVNRVGCEIQTIAAKLAGFRHVLATIHNLPGEDPAAAHWVRRAVEKVSFACADRLIAVSRATYDSWHQRVGLTPDKTVTIYNGLDPEPIEADARARFRAVAGIEPESFVFGICARLHPMKGHGLLLNAFAEVYARDSRVRLLIAGHGPEEARIRDDIQRLGLERQVRLVGHIAAPFAFLAAVDVHVLPSVMLESMPYAVIEAMLAGVPSIVSDVGGAKEAIRACNGGRVVPRGDVEALAGAMTWYAADPQRGRQDGARARTFAEAHLTGRSMRESTWQVYRGMCFSSVP